MMRRNRTQFASRFSGAGTLCFALLLCAVCLPAEQPGSSTPWDVHVGLENAQLVPPMVLAVAKVLASRMLAMAGVNANWNRGPLHPADYDPGCANPPLSIEVFFASPDDARDNTHTGLAYTYPYDTVKHRIIVSYYRLSAQVSKSPELSSAVLAHILVHEITHLLERTERHSDSGLMKAAWSPKDFYRMKNGPLPFELEDLELIRLGRKSWARALCEDARPSREVARANPKGK